MNFLFWASAGEGITIPDFAGLGIRFTGDGFRIVYGCIALFMWLMTSLASVEYFKQEKHKVRFYVFFYLTLFATLGVFFSGDLFTCFLFFEMMSFTSYVWVAQEENHGALRAADTYLAIAVTGGLVMLMGIFMVYHSLGTLRFDEMAQAAALMTEKTTLYVAGACITFGFGAKAGAFPLHIWLPKAHTVAPAPASALLSGILTKTGIFGILIVTLYLLPGETSWGIFIIWIGLITMLLGAVLGVFSVNLKRTLACSSMSQIGFILVGVGLSGLLYPENSLAVHGTVLHMINHSLIKLVLFMCAGVIYKYTHSLDLNEIKGSGRGHYVLMVSFLVGALSISGIPLFSGYVSKTLLHEAILEAGLASSVEVIFLFSGGLTLCYMTKLFLCIFVEKEGVSHNGKIMTILTAFAIVVSATVLFVWGIIPSVTMDGVAAYTQSFFRLEEFGPSVAYFSPENLKGALISITIGAVVYVLFVRKVLVNKEGRYLNVWPQWLDLEDRIYRPLFLTILPTIFGVICRVLDSALDTVVVLLRRSIYRDSKLPQERKEGNAVTEWLGLIMNKWQALADHTWNKSHPGGKDYVHILAMRREERLENNRLIARSMSFGLMLAGIGLALMLFYLIWG